MLFGTQVGVAPGTLTMQLGNVPGMLTYTQNGPQALCPPDPVWNYFPNPFVPYTYAQPPTEQCAPSQPVVVQPINVMPPNMPPNQLQPAKGPPTNEIPGKGDQYPVPSKGDQLPPVVVSPPNQGPSNQLGCPPACGPAYGMMNPYANMTKLSGLGRALGDVGPFGMTWAGFIGVMAVALGGGVGLGYLSKRRRK